MIAVSLSERLTAILTERDLLVQDIMSGNVPPDFIGRAHNTYYNLGMEIENIRWQINATDTFEVNISCPSPRPSTRGHEYSSAGALPDDTIEITKQHGKRVYALPAEDE